MLQSDLEVKLAEAIRVKTEEWDLAYGETIRQMNLKHKKELSSKNAKRTRSKWGKRKKGISNG